MKINYKILVVEDADGNKEASVINEYADTVQFCCIGFKDDERLYFEAEAYHLNKWCEDNNLKFIEINKTEDI